EGAKIRVTTSSRSQTTTFLIEDNGVGIPDASLPHVFDRFYRADGARSEGHETRGFGLGLSLAKLIADLHQGEIVLSSTPGKGTRALVRLPAAKAQRP
ncbi:MAG: BaeS12, partial [Candidatus Saccharibacteria bacterium]|nr:BaeS12 [Candidatus Saccharibacteria bacterium]